MMYRTMRLGALAAAITAAACGTEGVSQLGQSATLPATRFAELHYDNTGTDTGEAIEIEGPAGTDLTGWSIVLYDGNGGAVYNTKALTGTIPATCDTRGVAVFTYPTNGIQNGSPDGMALVDNSGAVVEFLSYEGTFTAVGGAANGRTSVDIIASEPSSWREVGKRMSRTTRFVIETRARVICRLSCRRKTRQGCARQHHVRVADVLAGGSAMKGDDTRIDQARQSSPSLPGHFHLPNSRARKYRFLE